VEFVWETHSSDIWNMVPLCLMWLIWKERNCRTFEDKENTESQMLNEFSISLFDWLESGT
jgi:hypothetical protein